MAVAGRHCDIFHRADSALMAGLFYGFRSIRFWYSAGSDAAAPVAADWYRYCRRFGSPCPAAVSRKPDTLMKILGILNITSDSFSDGGRYLEPGAARAHAEAMVQSGADIIDIGAASSNPDSAT